MCCAGTWTMLELFGFKTKITFCKKNGKFEFKLIGKDAFGLR